MRTSFTLKSVLLCIAFLILAIILSFSAIGQNVLTTSGNKIIDPCGNEFIMRGINYSIADDWNFPANLNNGKELSKEIILANPNTVRIQWYVDYNQEGRSELTLSSLDSVISRFARANIVSVVELHDFTHIHTDTTAFNSTILEWWKRQDVRTLIDKHHSHFILNIANEYGPALWNGAVINPNYNAEIVNWTKHYKSVIRQLRNAGITVPLMVDAPNYGQDYQTVIDVAEQFKVVDQLERIIMSCHAYWDSDENTITSIVQQLSQLSVPVVFGEIGNVDFICTDIQMETLLTQAKAKNMGWMAWTWHRDGDCVDRNMTNSDISWNSSNDGLFSTLTPYGQQIVNNAFFGLAATATKAVLDCEASIQLTEERVVRVYPNSFDDLLRIDLTNYVDEVEVKIVDMLGKTVIISNELGGAIRTINTTQLQNGFFILRVIAGAKLLDFKVLKDRMFIGN